MDQPGKKDQAEEIDQVEKRIMRRKRQKNKTRSKDCSAKVDTPQNRSRNRTKKNSIPDRWLKYEPIGQIMPDCRIIAFKTPLESSRFMRNSELQKHNFEISSVIQHMAGTEGTISLVVDLTDTSRYYDSDLWLQNGVEYIKIQCPGSKIHRREDLTNKFINTLRNFFEKNPEKDKIVGVHCTHGLNRTGYLICRYLMEVLNWDITKAIETFEKHRGHPIEKKIYIDSLHQVYRSKNPQNVDDEDNEYESQT